MINEKSTCQVSSGQFSLLPMPQDRQKAVDAASFFILWGTPELDQIDNFRGKLQTAFDAPPVLVLRKYIAIFVKN